MDIRNLSTKDRGLLGEKLAAGYLHRHGHTILGRNIARKTGEIDILTQKDDTLHFVEVKTLLCKRFPMHASVEQYAPEDNLSIQKIRKVARTAEWIVGDMRWRGEWQVDAALVWLREADGHGWVRYLPQIL